MTVKKIFFLALSLGGLSLMVFMLSRSDRAKVSLSETAPGPSTVSATPLSPERFSELYPGILPLTPAQEAEYQQKINTLIAQGSAEGCADLEDARYRQACADFFALKKQKP